MRAEWISAIPSALIPLPSSLFSRVCLIQELNDFFFGIAQAEEAAEHVFLQIGEDDVHRLQMLLGLVFRAEQQHDAVHRLVIQRGRNPVPRRSGRSCRPSA